jgi:hypothetical protein
VSAVRRHPVAVACVYGTVSVAHRGASGQACAGKGGAPRLHAMTASLTLLHLHSIPLPAIVHMPRQECGRGPHGHGGAGAVRRLPAVSLHGSRVVARYLMAEARRLSSPWQGASPAQTRAAAKPSRAHGPHCRSAPHCETRRDRHSLASACGGPAPLLVSSVASLRVRLLSARSACLCRRPPHCGP